MRLLHVRHDAHARALLDRRGSDPAQPPLTDTEIREAISGQICRCIGYATIVRSIRRAADREREVTE